MLIENTMPSGSATPVHLDEYYRRKYCAKAGGQNRKFRRWVYCVSDTRGYLGLCHHLPRMRSPTRKNGIGNKTRCSFLFECPRKCVHFVRRILAQRMPHVRLRFWGGGGCFLPAFCQFPVTNLMCHNFSSSFTSPSSYIRSFLLHFALKMRNLDAPCVKSTLASDSAPRISTRFSQSRGGNFIS